MTIIERIRAGRQSLPKGVTPDCILLGRLEFGEIERLAVSLGIHRSEIYLDGVRVLRVEAAQHLSFGIEPLSPCS